MKLHVREDGGADARVALLTALAIIVAVLLSPSPLPPLLILAAALALRGRLRLAAYGKHLVPPLAIAAFVWLTFAYTFGTTPVAHVLFPVYEEGIARGFLIFTRVLAATSVLLLLLEVTSLMALLRAMRWMRVPEVLVDLAGLTYRYLFVLEEERERLAQAMASRLGFARRLPVARRIAHYGTVASHLLIRSFDRSLRTYEAMESRGYKGGRLYDLRADPPKAGHAVLGGLASVAAVLLAWGWWLPW